MQDWLITPCELFGLRTQNWLLLIVAGLAVYAAVLYLLRRHRHAR